MNAVVCLRLNEKETGKNERQKKLQLLLRCACALYMLFQLVSVCIIKERNNQPANTRKNSHFVPFFNRPIHSGLVSRQIFIIFIYMDGAHKKQRWMASWKRKHWARAAVLLYWVFVNLNHNMRRRWEYIYIYIYIRSMEARKKIART